MKWTTKDGVIMEVEDMDKDHAYNTIQMLLRNNKPQVLLECLLVGRKKLLDDAAKRKSNREFTLEGDIAQMHVHDNAVIDIEEQTLDPSWYKEGL